PAHRYASAGALAHDLDRFVRGEPVGARKLTLLEQAARLVRHRQVDTNWGALATLVLCLAPLPLLAQATLFLLLPHRPASPPVTIGVPLAMATLLLSLIFFGKPATLRAVAPAQRREYLSTWLGYLIGLILVAFTILALIRPTTPEEWVVIPALWVILVGCT